MHLATLITTVVLVLAATVKAAVVAAPFSIEKPFAVELPNEHNLAARQGDIHQGVDCNGYCSGTKHCCAFQDGLYSRCHSPNTPCSQLSFPDALSADSPYPGHTTPLTTSFNTDSVTTTPASSASEVTVSITGSASMIGGTSFSSEQGESGVTVFITGSPSVIGDTSSSSSTTSTPPVRGGPDDPPSVQPQAKAALTTVGAHILTDTSVRIVPATGTTTIVPSSAEWMPLALPSDNELTTAGAAGSTITTAPGGTPTSLPASAPWEGGEGLASIVSVLTSWLGQGFSFSFNPTSTASAPGSGTQTHSHATPTTSSASTGNTLMTSPSPLSTATHSASISLPLHTSRTNTVTPEQQSTVTSTTVEASTTATLDGEPSAEASSLDGSDGAPLGSTNGDVIVMGNKVVLKLVAGLVMWIACVVV